MVRICPSCGGQMRVIAFIEDPKAIDKIMRHLKLSFQAERPPPSQLIQQELLGELSNGVSISDSRCSCFLAIQG